MTVTRTINRRALGAGMPAIMVALFLAGCQTSGVYGDNVDNSPGSAANIESLSAVIEANPSDAAAYNTRGIAYGRAGRFDVG